MCFAGALSDKGINGISLWIEEKEYIYLSIYLSYAPVTGDIAGLKGMYSGLLEAIILLHNIT